jgi:uncharacterized protein
MQFKKAADYILSKLANELPKHLTYHNTDHVKDVYTAAGQIGKQEGITVRDMKLLLTAALFHDAGFLRGAKDHEDESCRVAAATLPAYGYSPADITKIQGIIMATRLPQSPTNHLEQILADADLDYLGRDDFFTTGEKLYKEFLVSKVVANEEDWNKLQVCFLENHHYFTKTAIKLRQTGKEAHLKLIKAKLKT